jgi:hypothetical protein
MDFEDEMFNPVYSSSFYSDTVPASFSLTQPNTSRAKISYFKSAVL